MKKSGTGGKNVKSSGGKGSAGKSVGGARHHFTVRAAPKGERGGFQTVACSPKLSSLVEAVEALVEGYQAPEAEASRCRQLLPVPGRGGVYALTTFTPTGLTPEGRPGNYWAETVVVPAAWLEQAGWDAAAAFTAIDWEGPQDLAGLPPELPPVELPAFEPGPLSRLAALHRAVPEPLLYPLLLAVIQQSHGLRPVRILEATDSDPQLLEVVVTLLPLLVPPALRTYRDGEQNRCLTLRTRSPRGGMSPAADVTGFPAAAVVELEQEQGSVVIDLGGGLPAPELRERFGEAYVRWLTGVLREGRWGELEKRYAEEITGPAAGWFAGFRLDQAAARSPAAAAAAEPEEAPEETETVPSVYRIREAGWQVRAEAEAEAWKVLESQRRQFEETLAGLQRDLADAVARASERLKEHAAEQRALVEGKAEKALQASKAAAKKSAPGTARGRELEERIEDLEKEIYQLKRQHQQVRDELRSQGLAVEEVGSVEQVPFPEAAARRRDGEEEGRGRRFAGLGERFRSFIAPPKKQRPARKGEGWGVVRWVWQVGAGLIAVILLGLTLVQGVGWLFPGGGQGSPDGAGGGTGATTDGNPEPPDLTEAQRRQALLERLQDGSTAAALLREAAGREHFEDRAYALLLVHVMPRTAPLPDGTKVAFLQQALDITVDADWGRGSSDALESNLSDRCRACRQTERGWEGAGLLAKNGNSASCFLSDYLQLSDPPCDGESPWRPGRVWAEAEAMAALGLFRATRTTLEESGQPNRRLVAAQIARLDPAAPEGKQLWEDVRRSREKLPTEYAETLLGLAYSLITDDPEAAAAPGDIPEDRLDEIEALLDQAVSPEKPQSESGRAG